MWGVGMAVFEMVAIIVIASLLAGLVREWIRAKKVDEVDLSPIDNRLKNLEILEERVRVLEAIVTDKGYDLKQKIDQL